MFPYDRVLARYRDALALRAGLNLMSWDQQVLMPSGGAPARAAHQQLLSRMVHERLTSDEMRVDLENAVKETDPDSDQGRSLAALKRDLDSLTKLPSDLVVRKSKAGAEGYEAWKLAKATNDFAKLAPYLKELFDIAVETADRLGYEDHPYDALINLFEHQATHSAAQAMFDAIKQPIIDLVNEIRSNGRPVDDSALARDWDRPKLRAFAEQTARTIGFDFERGRLDVAPNAFCSGTGYSDVRMTTRASDHLRGIFSSSMHEMGHGLYEQGSPPEYDRTPLSGGVSLAVHESQSRLWENVVARSHGFWQHFLPDLAQALPQLQELTVDDIYRGINKVEPNFIRVGADELTYNLHILIRFELETEIITGKLQIKDLPEAWNAKYQAYLGITPPTDTEGCLQDVHWSRGSIGYFPTYSMGNLIGLQIWETLRQDIPDPEASFAKGDFHEVLAWLQEKIYREARRHTPRELITQVTGRPMEAGPWLRYAQAKYRAIYGI